MGYCGGSVRILGSSPGASQGYYGPSSGVGVEKHAIAISQLGQQSPGSPREGPLTFVYFWGGNSKKFWRLAS